MTVLKEEFSNKLGRLFSLSLRIKQEYEYLTENMDCTHARDILERKYFNRANGKHDESFYLTVTASLDFLVENRFPEGGLASAVPMTETDIVFVNEENMVSPVKFTQRSHSVYPFEPLILRLSKRNLFETNDGFHYPYFDHLSKKQIRNFKQRFGKNAMEYYHAMLIEKLLKYRRFFVCVIVEEDATDRYLGEQSAFGAMVALTCQLEKIPCKLFFCVGDGVVDSIIPEIDDSGEMSA